MDIIQEVKQTSCGYLDGGCHVEVQKAKQVACPVTERDRWLFTERWELTGHTWVLFGPLTLEAYIWTICVFLTLKAFLAMGQTEFHPMGRSYVNHYELQIIH